MSMLKLRPGVNAELTPSQLESGYAVSNLIRFRDGLAEKLGGWRKFYQFAVGGVPKALHAWQDLNDVRYLGVGTTTLLGAIADSVLTDLTPQTYVSDFTPDFDTTNLSPNVTVDDPNVATITDFDSVEFNTPVSVGGIILSGVYPVALNLGATTYRIIAATNATSTVASGGAVPAFTTTNGSATVTVAFTAHGLSVGGTINFPIPTTVGGLVIEGTYTALTVPGANSFTIAAATLATSGATVSMNGGEVQIVYHIAIGPVPAGTGYGIGTYGSGGYGTGSAPGQQTGTPITAIDWSLDNWQQTLLACPDGGGLYQWTPGQGLLNAQLIGTAPPKNTGMFVATEVQIAVLYGSTDDQDIGVDQSQMLVRWSAQGDFTDYRLNLPAGTSQAGQRLLTGGSRIVGAMPAPLMNLIWTDASVWAMQYQGAGSGVFGFNPIAFGCGLVGKHAVCRQGANVYWMSQTNFYVLGGGAPQVIPCSVWDVVFQDLNTADDPVSGRKYSDKCWAWANTPFNEIWFFFPRASTNATEPDFFVKYNTAQNVWDYGPLDRTAGINQSLLGMPISATPGGLIYEHEVSRNGDGAAINAYFESGLFQLSEGNDIIFIDWILPDMKFGDFGDPQTASLTITFTSYYYTGGTARVYSPITYNVGTKFKSPRIRGRFVKFKIESNDLDSFWRLGGMRFRGAVDGSL
jgi:hypothetical protein